MTSPATRTQLETRLQDVCRVYEQIRRFVEDGTPSAAVSWLNMQDTLTQNLIGNFSSEALAGIRAQREALVDLYGNSDALEAVLQDWGEFLETADPLDTLAVLDDMYADFITQSKSVTTRGITYSSPTASGSPEGTGEILLCTVDARGYIYEDGFGADNFEAICVADQHTGADRHAEEFLIRSDAPAQDILELKGQGFVGGLSGIDPRQGLLQNSSFDEREGTNTVPTAVTNWTSSVGVSASVIQFLSGNANCFLQARDSDDIVRCIQILSALVLSQDLADADADIDPETPYFLGCAASGANASGNTTLTLRLGAISASFTISAGASFTFHNQTLGQNSWYRQFADTPLDVEIEISSLQAGDKVEIDDVILAPLDQLANYYAIARPGATSWRAGTVKEGSGDRYTWPVSASEAVIQRHLARFKGRMLPYDSAGGATLADPL